MTRLINLPAHNYSMENKPKSVIKTENMASELKLNCEFFYHKETGKTTADAEKACNLKANQIIKCLLLKSEEEYLGVILRGSDRLDLKEIERKFNYKKLRMATSEEVYKKLGYNIGGVPITSFYENNVVAKVDNNLLEEDLVVGAGGDEHYGMKFNPKQVIERLNYPTSELIQKNEEESEENCELNKFEKFAKIIDLTSEEKKGYTDALKTSLMPFAVSEHFTNLILKQKGKYRTQLTNIVLPSLGKKNFKGRFDPYGNKTVRKDSTTFLQHKYEPTLLLHIVDSCFANCQFCYKIKEIKHEKIKNLSIDEKISSALNYLDKHPEVNNILLTGGDPGVFNNEKIIKIISKLIEPKNIRAIRFATKGLSYNPKRFLDEELLNFFKEINQRKGKQICMVAQINHPAEIDEISALAIKKLQDVGVQIRGQPAIIKGVNDSVDTLIDLQRTFLDHKILSYYLTIFMPVGGVEQYGLKLHEIFKNIAESKRKLSGLEKKGVVLASHDFGKFEICGFLPNLENPKKIILKWHEAAMPQYLPKELKEKILTRPEDLLMLNYNSKNMYCIDHVFKANDLPYFDEHNKLVIP